MRVHGCHIQEYGLHFTTCQRKRPVQSPHTQPEPQQSYSGEETLAYRAQLYPPPSQTASGTTRRHRSLVRLLHTHVTAHVCHMGDTGCLHRDYGWWGSNRSMTNTGSLTLGGPQTSDTIYSAKNSPVSLRGGKDNPAPLKLCSPQV